MWLCSMETEGSRGHWLPAYLQVQRERSYFKGLRKGVAEQYTWHPFLGSLCIQRHITAHTGTYNTPKCQIHICTMFIWIGYCSMTNKLLSKIIPRCNSLCTYNCRKQDVEVPYFIVRIIYSYCSEYERINIFQHFVKEK